uniref:Galectin n=1 Tax=Pelodiscus sinensis TaxID=13735 RepID=K7GBB3_PELSI
VVFLSPVPQCLPFTGPIDGSLSNGMMVIISGTVSQNCDRTRFHIDFESASSQNPQNDIAFHFNPRFEEGGYVVCNTFENQSWGKEERKYKMPFLKGHSFKVKILVKHDSFMVTVNEDHFLEYKHRIPVHKVKAIGVAGGMEVSDISFQKAAGDTCTMFTFASMGYKHSACSQSPELMREAGPLGIWPFDISPCTKAVFSASQLAPGSPLPPNPIHPPEPYQPQPYPMPYRTSMAGGLSPSKSVIITGISLPKANRFHVNLKRDEDIAFQLNPRFSEKAIVRNTKLNQIWGPEERSLSSDMPFVHGKGFIIWIVCDAHCFKVAVNGQHQFDYKHRVPNLQEINLLEIEGDVLLTCVQV